MNPSSTHGLPYDDLADGKMLEGIAAGDRESFRLLYERYAGLLFATIQKIINDHNDTEEVLQEVMNSLWQRPISTTRDAAAPSPGWPRPRGTGRSTGSGLRNVKHD